MNGCRLRLRASAFVLLLALISSLVLPCSAFLPGRSSRSGNAASGSPQTLPSADPHPTARDQELSTYRNVAITGQLAATDPKGGGLTYQLISHPARGSVTLAGDGSGAFVYTPYENKLGRDSFRFTVRDQWGNVSPPATVKIRIVKPDTRVTYEDMDGHPAHKAAVHLAEAGLFVGEQVGGRWFFNPDRPVSRARFLTMAMDTVRKNERTPVMLTGFHDDEAIPVWAKASVASALKSGIISGSKNEYGAPVFAPEQTITCGEAAVMLDKLLQLPDVPVEVFSPGCGSHWAVQAAANLSASGVSPAPVSSASLAQPLTMSEAARLLDGALTVLDGRP